LIIDSKKGLIIITGCAHPGIVNIVKRAKGLMKKDKVYLVLGGFTILLYLALKNLKNCKLKRLHHLIAQVI